MKQHHTTYLLFIFFDRFPCGRLSDDTHDYYQRHLMGLYGIQIMSSDQALQINTSMDTLFFHNPNKGNSYQRKIYTGNITSEQRLAVFVLKATALRRDFAFRVSEDHLEKRSLPSRHGLANC